MAVFIIGVLLATSKVSVAQLSAQDKAVADSFFNDGVKLLRAGDLEHACPKLVESERIDPAVGTALYLGDCFERLGKIASAQAMFQEAYDYARRRGDARAGVAKDHHDRLNPSMLTLAVAQGALIAGLVVVRDDASVPLLQLGVPLPIDGGAHVIAATAAGKKRFSTTITVAPSDAKVTVTIPPLADEATSRELPSAAPSDGRTRRVIGLVVAAAGVATIGLGAGGGLVATLDWNASNSTDNQCNSGTTACLTQHGVDLRASAQSWATVSTVGFVAGGVLAVAGAILLFTTPKAKSSAAWTVGPIFVAGRF